MLLITRLAVSYDTNCNLAGVWLTGLYNNPMAWFLAIKRGLILAGLAAIIGFGVVLWLNQQSDSKGISSSDTPIITTTLAPTTPTPTIDPSITLRVTGDVLLARTVNQKMQLYQDFNWPFAQVTEFLNQADLTLINLENPIVPGCQVKLGGFVFCGPPEVVAGLHTAGIDIVGLANNHMANYGIEGVMSTAEILTREGLAISGLTSSPSAVVTVKNKRIGVAAFNDIGVQAGVMTGESESIRHSLTNLKKQADLVIAFFHWGNEYEHQPTDRQRRLARQAIDHGADLVLGNHPHWWQPSETYQGKLIVYSHGNFVFDQMWSEETRLGLVGTYLIHPDNSITAEFTPIKIYDYGQPKLLTGQEKDQALQSLSQETDVLRAKPFN